MRSRAVFTDELLYSIEKNILAGKTINACARMLGISNSDSIRRVLIKKRPHLLPFAALNGKNAQRANAGVENKKRYHEGCAI